MLHGYLLTEVNLPYASVHRSLKGRKEIQNDSFEGLKAAELTNPFYFVLMEKFNTGFWGNVTSATSKFKMSFYLTLRSLGCRENPKSDHQLPLPHHYILEGLSSNRRDFGRGVCAEHCETDRQQWGEVQMYTQVTG